MSSILPRSSWTSTRPGFSRMLQASKVTGAVLHYPGDGNHTRAGLSREANEALIRAYRSYHVNSRKWPDIGYCYAISQSGDIWEAAGNRVAAHSATSTYPLANHENIGILLIIGNNEKPSAEMIVATNWLLATLKQSFPKMSQLRGHRQVRGAATTCCGDQAISMINSNVFSITAALDDGAASTPPPLPIPPAATAVPPKNSHAKRKYAAGEVKRIQIQLKNAGYYRGFLDDDYGSMTWGAVRAYHAQQLYAPDPHSKSGKLFADGDWGPKTQDHYEWVKLLQSEMNKWKSSHPKLIIDGDYRAITVRRVRDIQQRNLGTTTQPGAYRRAGGRIVDADPGPITCTMLGIPTHPGLKL